MINVLRLSSVGGYFDKSILVNAGLNAIGQATIAIAILSGYTIYATVENKEQSILLRNKFPSVRTFKFHHTHNTVLWIKNIQYHVIFIII